MLLWDCDGTIVDTEPVYFAATEKVLAERGVKVPQNFYETQYLQHHRGALDYARSLGMDEPTVQSLREKRNILYEQMLQKRITLMEGAMETVASLSQSYRMAIVSNSRRRHLDLILDRCGLRTFFEFTLASEDFMKEKPAPDPYLAAMKKANLSASDCLAIEDSLFGIESAKRAGLTCVAIHSAMDQTRTSADKVIRTIRELPEFLQRAQIAKGTRK